MKYFILFIVILTPYLGHAALVDLTFSYSAADEVERDRGGDIKAEDAFVLGFRFKDSLNKGLGWNAGMSMDTPRDLEGNRGLGFILVEGNATLKVDQLQLLYIFAGFNYPLIVYQDKNIGDVDSSFGVQFGTGLVITPQFGFELAFRVVNFEMDNVDADLWGFLFRGYYTFR